MRQRAYQRNGKMKKNFHFGTTGKKAWLLALSLLCFCTTAVAQTIYISAQSGLWSDPDTWGTRGTTNTIPGTVEGDIAIIRTGDIVTLDESPLNTLASVTVNGTLRYDARRSRTLRARTVTVNSGGTIDLAPARSLTHELRLEPLSTDPANIATTFQNNGRVEFVVNTLTTCVTRFTRSTKGPQSLIGTGTFNLGTVVMENTSTVLPPDDFASLPETDATQTIGQQGGSAITMQNLLIDNAVARVRGTTFTSPTRYREDNPTIVLVPLTISQNIILERGILILNGANNTSLIHTVRGNIEIGSENSIAEEHTDSRGERGARHNTGIALVSATNATTNLTVTGDVTAPNLSHLNEGVVIALVSPASGTGVNIASTSGATMTVDGDFNLSGARLGLVGNGTLLFLLAGDIGPGKGGFATGTMQFNFRGDFRLKDGSRYNGRRGGGGSVPTIRFDGTSPQTFSAPPSVWFGDQTNAITNWEIAARSQVTMTSNSGIAIHGGFGLTVDGTLIAEDGAELISTFTGSGSGRTVLTMGSNGIIRVADPEGLGNGNQIDPDPTSNFPLFIGRTSPGSLPPTGWNLTSINTAGTIDYNGTALQTITARNSSTAPNIQYHRLTISGGDKTLESTNGSVVVNNQLTLQGGIVNRVNASDVVQVLNNATGAVTRTSGHINARLERAVTGVSQTYLFPIGDNTTYREISLRLTSLGTSLRAELIEDNANDLAGVNSPLRKVSDLRYYSFFNTGSNVTISQVQNMAINADDAVNQVPSNTTNTTLKIATRVVGENWQSRGPAEVNTSNLPTIFSSDTFSESVAANSTFFVSLGTTNPTDDPLPVELVVFKGEATVLGVMLEWQTASERDNAGFVLMRNGEVIADYREHAALRGAGTSAVGRRYRFIDERVREGERYVYALRSVDFDGTVHDYAVRVEVEGKRVSRDYELMQNYPNPFNPVTTIRYVLPEESEVRVRVYDMLGRLVKELVGGVRQGAGVYEVRFEGSGLGSGVYVYRLEAVGSRGRYVASKKMVLMK
jgi:hypothetical protein